MSGGQILGYITICSRLVLLSLEASQNITGKKICAYYLITYLAIIVVRRRGGVCVPHEGGGRPVGGSNRVGFHQRPHAGERADRKSVEKVQARDCF